MSKNEVNLVEIIHDAQDDMYQINFNQSNGDGTYGQDSVWVPVAFLEALRKEIDRVFKEIEE